MDRAAGPLTPTQSAALRRARALAAELTADLWAARAALDAIRSEPGRLEQDELRAAFTAARRSARPSGRPRWADELLSR